MKQEQEREALTRGFGVWMRRGAGWAVTLCRRPAGRLQTLPLLTLLLSRSGTVLPTVYRAKGSQIGPRTAGDASGSLVPRVTLRPPWDDSEGPRQGEPCELGRTPLVGACLSASPTSAPSYTPPLRLVVTPGITSKVRRGSASRGSQPETRGGPRRPCLGRRRHGRLLARWRADRTVMRAQSQAVAVSQTRHGPCERTC